MTFVRYLIIQGGAYILDMGSFIIIKESVDSGALVANLGAKLIAGLFAFVAHRYFTFPAASGRGMSLQAIKYFSILALNIPASMAVLSGALEFVENAVLAKFLSDIACLILTYWISRSHIFTPGHQGCTLDKEHL